MVCDFDLLILMSNSDAMRSAKDHDVLFPFSTICPKVEQLRICMSTFDVGQS
jgi:hypothetical protein